MAKMILAQRKMFCGCCGPLPDAKNLGNHATETGKRIKRALKRKDRHSWKKDAF